MSEEAKSAVETATVATSGVAVSVPHTHAHADTAPSVSKFDQSSDPIPKVVPPRGSKDARSFRPSTLAEINMMNRYEPLEWNACGRKIPVGCGNSLEDVLLICGCIFALWSFVIGIVGLMLKSAIDTDRNHTALWVYFWVFVLGLLLLAGMIATGQVERHRAEAAQAQKQQAQDEAQAMTA